MVEEQRGWWAAGEAGCYIEHQWYTVQMLVALRTCFCSEHSPDCDRYQRNCISEAPPDVEDLSGKWRAVGHTRGETSGIILWLISQTSPSVGRQRQSIIRELMW